MVWNFRTLSDPVRPSSVAMPCSLSMLLPTQGPFPPPALPGFPGTTGLSATLEAQTAPRGVPVRCVPHHPQGFPCCCLLPLPCVPASLPRRVQRGARVARFPLRLRPSPFLRWVGPRIARFEACSTFTRVPARMFAEPPYAALCHQSASDPCRCLHGPPWLLPTGATVVGRVSHPLEEGAFPWRTEKCGLGKSGMIPDRSYRSSL